MGTRVHHQGIQTLVVVRQRSISQPVAKFVHIRRIQQFFKRAKAFAETHRPGPQGEQVQVVVSEYADRGVAEAFDKA